MGIFVPAMDVATIYRLEPALEAAVSANGRASSVLLGDPPLVRDLSSLIDRGTALVAQLAALPIDAEAEARFERLLAQKRGTPARTPLKAK